MTLDAKIIEQQIKNLSTERDRCAQIFQQCVGAIAALQEQLNFIAEEEKKGKDIAPAESEGEAND